ncbi:MAG: hypothetical protein RBT47_09345 [Anaerolineae bacterium]|jgi:outer membrane biosynthesis protein TonB|nr:hypothetical protein [Anaerolineae bacterium]
MSDDLRDTFGEDIFSEPEEEEIKPGEGETQNRTFLIAVAVLGGLLFVAIAAFILWAAVLNPRMQAQRTAQNGEIEATNEAIMVAMNSTATAEAEIAAQQVTPKTPADTPAPTATETPVIKATNTPTPAPTSEGGEGEATPEETAEASEDATGTPQAPRRTPTPAPTATRTPRPTATPRAGAATPGTSGQNETPDTGLGEILLIIAAGLLISVIAFARRLRKA